MNYDSAMPYDAPMAYNAPFVITVHGARASHRKVEISRPDAVIRHRPGQEAATRTAMSVIGTRSNRSATCR